MNGNQLDSDREENNERKSYILCLCCWRNKQKGVCYYS